MRRRDSRAPRRAPRAAGSCAGRGRPRSAARPPPRRRPAVARSWPQRGRLTEKLEEHHVNHEAVVGAGYRHPEIKVHDRLPRAHESAGETDPGEQLAPQAAGLVGGPGGVGHGVEPQALPQPEAVGEVGGPRLLGAHPARLVAVHAGAAEEPELVLAEAVEVVAGVVAGLEPEPLEGARIKTLTGLDLPARVLVLVGIEIWIPPDEPPGLPLGAAVERALEVELVAGAREAQAERGAVSERG